MLAGRRAIFILENILFALVLVIALLPVVTAINRMSRWRVHAFGASLVALILLVSLIKRPAEDTALKNALPAATTKAGFLPSSACRSCHPDEYRTWYGSYHRTMTQVASPETVLAPFDGRRLTNRGRSFIVERKGDDFWISEMATHVAAGKEERLSSRRVVMLTGSHYQQIYWTGGHPDGSLRQFVWVYEIVEKTWIPTEDSFLHPPGAVETEKVWNNNCVRCHSVGQQPNYSKTDEWKTEVTELGIACAACHGPAKEHIERHQNPVDRLLTRFSDAPDDTIVNPSKLPNDRGSEVCAQCHAHVTPKPGFFTAGKGQTYRAGQKLLEHYDLERYDGKDTNQFWPDGSARIGGREFNSMTLSGCYTKGTMSCMSCHSMHVKNPQDQIKPRMEGNEGCVQCHKDIGSKVRAHTFHDPKGAGSLCYNCHMPYTSYALLSTARAHRMDSPRLTGFDTTEPPNACNLCHLNKSLSWTAKYLNQWYDQPLYSMPPLQSKVAASVNWVLRGNVPQRAITTWHMGQPWTQKGADGAWVLPYLADLLMDDYTAIRMMAYRSLRRVMAPEKFTFNYLAKPAEREKARQEVLERWRQSRMVESAPTHDPETLTLPDGRIDSRYASPLKNQRDHTRFWMAE